MGFPWQSGHATRPAAVAGSFYPAAPAELRRLIARCFDDARSDAAVQAPQALIAPHAGYVYSGAVAASAWRTLAPLAGHIRRVVLAGPSHRVAFRGVALSSARRFATPLGDVDIDTDAAEALADLDGVAVLDEAHAGEHCLEVQLPMLQTVLDEPLIVPLVVGTGSAGVAQRVLGTLWRASDTAIVVSSDLSHYHPYREAQRLDAGTGAAIERLDDGALSPERACGCEPVRALLRLARERQLHAHTLDLRNSGDTAGDRRAVVGYGAFAFDRSACD